MCGGPRIGRTSSLFARSAPAILGDRAVMSRISDDRIRKQLDEAEGYLMLDLPERSLQILESRPDWLNMQFEASFLKGEALRNLKHFREALRPLEMAAALRPTDTRVALALGWCYKRTNRLAQAIDSLERALRAHPDDALLHYNLACYWSLAGNSSKALDELSTALEFDADLRALIANESDFHQLRGNPAFERLLGHAPLDLSAGRRALAAATRRVATNWTRDAIDSQPLSRRPDHLSVPSACRHARCSMPAAPQISSRIRWVISRSHTLHHFQRGCPINSSRCLMATRTERNQIFVSLSPTFSNLAQRAKCSKLDCERLAWALPLASAIVPWKMNPIASSRVSENSSSDSRLRTGADCCWIGMKFFPNPSTFYI